jgi:hypothetical protein
MKKPDEALHIAVGSRFEIEKRLLPDFLGAYSFCFGGRKGSGTPAFSPLSIERMSDVG